jgi:hypothetical protein
LRPHQKITRWTSPPWRTDETSADGYRPPRRSLRTLEGSHAQAIIERLERRWPGLGPLTGISEVALKRRGFVRHLTATDAAARGIRPLSVHPADACFHIPEMVAGLEWRLRHLVEHPVQACQIDGVRVVLALGTLLTVQWPSGQFSTFAWESDSSSRSGMRMFRMSTEQVVLQGVPWQWLWLDRLMSGFESELRAELVRQGRLTDAELSNLPQAFKSYMKDLTKVMKHRLRVMPAYRSMRQRIAAELKLDPVALDLAHRIADAPAQLQRHLTMFSSYNRAVEHKELLLKVQAEAPHLFTFYAGMLEDEYFPTEGEPLQRLRNQLHDEFDGHGPYRLLLKTPPRQFVLMRRFIAHLQHENYLDWLGLLHGLSPVRPVPEWLLRILVSQFGNERQRVHLYARYFWSDMPLWVFVVSHWVLLEQQPDEASLEEIRDVASWIIDGPAITLDRRQRQRGWEGLVKDARSWLRERQAESNKTPLPHARRIAVRRWEGWSLVPLTTEFEIWQEGTLMGHCLGRPNGPIDRGTTWFASLQHEGKRVLSCQFVTVDKRHNLVTAFGRFNATPTPEERRSLGSLLKLGTNDKRKRPAKPSGTDSAAELENEAGQGSVQFVATSSALTQSAVHPLDECAIVRRVATHGTSVLRCSDDVMNELDALEGVQLNANPQTQPNSVVAVGVMQVVPAQTEAANETLDRPAHPVCAVSHLNLAIGRRR